MTISTKRLVLGEISWSDTENIHVLHSIPEVDEFNTLGLPKSIDETKGIMQPFIDNRKEEKRTKICWVVEAKNNKEFIGICGMILSADKYRIGEIFYKLHPVHWGNGYATELSKALLDFGFNDLKLHRIEAGVAVLNIKSIKVLEKIGMSNEGIRRKILPIRGEWVDGYHFAIIEGDKRD